MVLQTSYFDKLFSLIKYLQNHIGGLPPSDYDKTKRKEQKSISKTLCIYITHFALEHG